MEFLLTSTIGPDPKAPLHEWAYSKPATYKDMRSFALRENAEKFLAGDEDTAYGPAYMSKKWLGDGRNHRIEESADGKWHLVVKDMVNKDARFVSIENIEALPKFIKKIDSDAYEIVMYYNTSYEMWEIEIYDGYRE